MLFWHLHGLENAHIRSSMLRFSFGRSLKIAIVIQFLGALKVRCWCELFIFDGGGGVAHFSALRHRRYKLTLEKK